MKLVSCLYDDHHPFYDLLSEDEQNNLNDCLKISVDPDELDAESILILWGGGDISPSLYKSKVSIRGGGSEQPNQRDAIEWAMTQQAIKLQIPIIGVCRGAQMLCAAAGGKLIQHFDNHAGRNHEITTVEGDRLTVNSLHHQLMYPFEVDHELLAWSSTNLSQEYHDEYKVLKEIPCEPELVVFPKIRGIAVQWHPEAMSAKSPASQYLLKTIKEVISREICA